MEIFIIIALVLLNGIFSMSEMALVSSRKFKLESSKKKGSKGAKTALELSEKPNIFLSTIQIGITVIGIFLGMYSGENLTTHVAEFFYQFEAIRPYAKNIATATILVLITYVSIVLGELFPKRLGMTFPESITILLARPMKVLSLIASPFVWFLSFSNDLLLKISGIKNKNDNIISEEEIKSIVKESAEGGEIQDIEQDIVERVFELGDRRVKTLFTHRSEIVYFNLTDTWETIVGKINEEKHSSYPVCENNDIDNVVGIVLLKDLFASVNEKDFDIKKYLKTPLYLNENTFAYRALELFKKQKTHYGIVVDEYGSTVGMVTMDDVIDALVGDTSEDYEDEYQIVERGKDSWLVDGQYSIIEFIKYFDLETEIDYNNKFATVGGLLINQNNNSLPNVGDRFLVGSFELEVVDKDGQRIDKVMVNRLFPETP